MSSLPPLSPEAERVYASVLAFSDQCADAWQQAKAVKIPAAYAKSKSLVFAGMGGSNLGWRLVSAALADRWPWPSELANHYQLPDWADKSTLVIASSYSGNTEETLMVAQQAFKRGCKVFVIAGGGQLVEWAQKKKVPFFAIVPTHNHAQQPRMALGYAIFGLLGVLNKLGVKTSDPEVKAIVKHLAALSEDWSLDRVAMTNRAAEIAQMLHGFIPLYVASEHLTGTLRIAMNQTHETAKAFATSFDLPELNHHLMEGLKNPATYTNRLRVLAFVSDRNLARIQKRFAITKRVVEAQGLTWVEYRPSAKTKLGEACEIALLSSFVTFYLSRLYRENPLAIPWVDTFKKELA